MGEKVGSRFWVLQAEIGRFVNGVAGSGTTEFVAKWGFYIGGFLNDDAARNRMPLGLLMSVLKCCFFWY